MTIYNRTFSKLIYCTIVIINLLEKGLKILVLILTSDSVEFFKCQSEHILMELDRKVCDIGILGSIYFYYKVQNKQNVLKIRNHT